MKVTLTAGTALALLAGSPAFAVVIGFEDFDGGAINLNGTLNVFNFNAGGGTLGDVFGRMDLTTGMPFDVADDSVFDVSGGGAGDPFPADVLGIAGQNATGFFGMNDMDGSGIDPVLNDATWAFDISGASSIDNIQIDIAAMGDFEASSTDGFKIEAQIDGAGWMEIFLGRADEDANKDYRPMDLGTLVNLNDPLALFIDGGLDSVGFLDKSDPDTGLFDTYTSLSLAGMSGTELELKISWEGTPSGSEPMGFDNFTINGVPAPGALALLGLAGLAVRRRR